MRILFINTGHRCFRDMRSALEEGTDIVISRKAEDSAELVRVIEECSPDFVFTLQYYDMVSEQCYRKGIFYVSYMIDFCMEMYTWGVIRRNNIIFAADYLWTEELKRRGAEHVWYLPAAACVERLDRVTSLEEERKICFAGSWEPVDEEGPFGGHSRLGEVLRGYLEGICNAQRIINGFDIFQSMLPDNLVQKLYEIYPEEVPAGMNMDRKTWYIYKYFYPFVNHWGRYLLIRRCPGCEWFVKEETEFCDNVVMKNCVDYYEEFPRLVKSSRINLNITNRRMVSGIPQRVFDIMGCGGCLLTDYQPELFWFFEPGKDFAYFENMDEFYYIMMKYWNDKGLREEMKEHACEAVRKAHTYHHRVENMREILDKF